MRVHSKDYHTYISLELSIIPESLLSAKGCNTHKEGWAPKHWTTYTGRIGLCIQQCHTNLYTRSAVICMYSDAIPIYTVVECILEQYWLYSILLQAQFSASRHTAPTVLFRCIYSTFCGQTCVQIALTLFRHVYRTYCVHTHVYHLLR